VKTTLPHSTDHPISFPAAPPAADPTMAVSAPPAATAMDVDGDVPPPPPPPPPPATTVKVSTAYVAATIKWDNSDTWKGEMRVYAHPETAPITKDIGGEGAHLFTIPSQQRMILIAGLKEEKMEDVFEMVPTGVDCYHHNGRVAIEDDSGVLVFNTNLALLDMVKLFESSKKIRYQWTVKASSRKDKGMSSEKRNRTTTPPNPQEERLATLLEKGKVTAAEFISAYVPICPSSGKPYPDVPGQQYSCAKEVFSIWAKETKLFFMGKEGVSDALIALWSELP
jgi:hypothetical protein